MDPIVIQRKEETNKGWRFVVEVGIQAEYRVGFLVSVDKDYWQELTLSKHSPERLIQETFRFLLAKETTKTALVRELGNSFNLKDVEEKYYSYKRRIKMALFGTEYPET